MSKQKRKAIKFKSLFYEPKAQTKRFPNNFSLFPFFIFYTLSLKSERSKKRMVPAAPVFTR